MIDKELQEIPRPPLNMHTYLCTKIGQCPYCYNDVLNDVITYDEQGNINGNRCLICGQKIDWEEK